MAADKTPPPKTPVTEKAPDSTTTTPPMIVQNADGTFVVQKEPPKDAPKSADGKKGLVIHPQVIVPTTTPSPDKK
ncbi:MAG TPA: hypothetical protein VL625_03880 [Patescibacteria group bacterium]|jgi:hypothetical protein|nr:hypothetical protein [Patescibacteria group bacterium]